MFALTSFYNVLLPTLLLLSPGPSSATPSAGFPSPADLLTARHGSPYPSHPFPASPFNFKPAFIKSLRSGPVLPRFDLPTCGAYFTAPVTNGTVSGPLLNGKVLGGNIDGTSYTDTTFTQRTAFEYGVTDDGHTFTLASDIMTTVDGVPILRVKVTYVGDGGYLSESFLVGYHVTTPLGGGLVDTTVYHYLVGADVVLPPLN